MANRRLYIAIAGNIGSGKTSLTEVLAERLGAKIFDEDINNPYLNDFYKDMSRWAFNLQIYFLGSRIKQSKEMSKCLSTIIQDRTVYEDAHIFAHNLHEMRLLSSRDFDSYMRIFNLISETTPRPDVLIYLKASVSKLVHQIQKRGRDYELLIEEGYLERLNQKYDNWIENLYDGHVITIDMDKEDFVENPETIEHLLDQLNRL